MTDRPFSDFNYFLCVHRQPQGVCVAIEEELCGAGSDGGTAARKPAARSGGYILRIEKCRSADCLGMGKRTSALEMTQMSGPSRSKLIALCFRLAPCSRDDWQGHFLYCPTHVLAVSARRKHRARVASTLLRDRLLKVEQNILSAGNCAPKTRRQSLWSQ